MKKKLGILPDLTKTYLLERLTQEEIMEYYMGIPVNDKTLEGNSFLSRMRKDNKPTCNYYYKDDSRGNSKLRLKDWNGSFNGDIFDVASYFTRINTNTSQGFRLLLHKIAKDFGVHKYTEGTERDKLDFVVQEHIKRVDLKVFKVIPRSWNNYDKQYWYDRFGIGSDLLKLGKVIPIAILEVEDKNGYLSKVYTYYSKDPAFAYYGGVIEGITIWKIYFPLRSGRRRFMSNYAFIQGLHMLQPARVCVITKSLKDVLCLRRYGIMAIAVPSESYVMTKSEIFDLKSKCDILITNFDYDRTGIMLAIKYRRVHNIQPFMFTKGKFMQIDFGVKDFSEYRNTYGHDKTQQFIDLLIQQHYDTFMEFNKYDYEALQWIV